MVRFFVLSFHLSSLHQIILFSQGAFDRAEEPQWAHESSPLGVLNGSFEKMG